MIKVSFYQILSKGKNKNEGPVYMRIKGVGEPINLSTGIYIMSSDWDKKKSIVKSKNPKSYFFNSEIKKMESLIWKYYEEKTKKGNLLDRHELKNSIRGIQVPQDSVLSTFQYFINQNEKTLSSGTVKHYKSTQKKLEKFIKKVFNKSDIILEELNYAFVTKFRGFLESDFKNHVNTMNKDISRLKSVINYAVRLEWVKDNPFRSYRSTAVPTVRSTLNINEINLIERCDVMGESLNIVKDTFLFMCFTGISYSDLKSLRHDDIQSTINGGRIIKFSRKKTNEYCMVPIIDKAQNLISKYQLNEKCISEGVVFPVLSNQKMNVYITRICRSLGISKKVSCHVARHSFATNALEFGVPIETVSKALGHSSIKTTQIYAKITENKLTTDFSKLNLGFAENKSLIQALNY